MSGLRTSESTAGGGGYRHGAGSVDYRCYFVTGAVADNTAAGGAPGNTAVAGGAVADTAVPRDGSPVPGDGSPTAGIANSSPAFRDLVKRCVLIARGGAGVIQVRSKPIAARDLYHLTAAIADAVAAEQSDLPVTDPRRTKILVDDRVDVALALMRAGHAVHGVHVGQDDLPVPAVRELLGPDAIIGLTTGTVELIEQANKYADLIDYVGCGPFRDTPTKKSGRLPLGLEVYPRIVAASALPVVAIGDVTIDDAPALAETGVAGLAVVRALMSAQRPHDYARGIVEGFDSGAALYSMAASGSRHRRLACSGMPQQIVDQGPASQRSTDRTEVAADIVAGDGARREGADRG